MAVSQRAMFLFHRCFDMKSTNEKLIFSHILILRSEVGKAVIGNQNLQGERRLLSSVAYLEIGFGAA